MKIKTSELQGVAMDWAVACIEKPGIVGIRADGKLGAVGNVSYSPSTDWAQGGPIIERENIMVLSPIVRRIAKERHAFNVDYWRAMIQPDENDMAIHGAGATPLIAAMRCFVASKLGDEVDVPEELAS